MLYGVVRCWALKCSKLTFAIRCCLVLGLKLLKIDFCYSVLFGVGPENAQNRLLLFGVVWCSSVLGLKLPLIDFCYTVLFGVGPETAQN